LKADAGTTPLPPFCTSWSTGTLTYTELTAADLQRMEHLVGQYTDLPLSAVDASVIAVAERLKVADIATLDHRDFRVVKPAHIPAFTLRP